MIQSSRPRHLRTPYTRAWTNVRSFLDKRVSLERKSSKMLSRVLCPLSRAFKINSEVFRALSAIRISPWISGRFDADRIYWLSQNNILWLYVFKGYASPLHSGVYVSGHFNALAAVAFLPPPRSPAKSMREPRSPPLLNH